MAVQPPGKVTVTVVPAATTSCAGTSVTVIAPASLTAGQTLTLSAVSSPAGSSTTYIWTGPAGFTSTASAPAIPTTTTANSGTYSLTIALSGPTGCTATASASVTVLPAGTTACTGLSASIAAPAGVTAGQPLSLTAIVSPGSAGMVYTWRGPNGFTATTPVAAIPTATTAHSGSYSLTVQVAGQSSCSATAATTITVVSSTDTLTTDCDIRIVSVDAAGQETVFIPRSVTGQNALTLSVENLGGTPLTGYTYRWTRTTGVQAARATSTTTGSVTATAPVTVTVGTTPTISATAIGEYMVVLTDAAGNTCVAYSTISAKPCNERTAAYSSCKDVTITNPDATNAISNLTPGDQFYAGDYKVTVTSITGGGPGGWTGEGIVDVTLLKGINLPAQVTFDNAKLNDCYELAAGKLVTKYDPSWFVTPDIQHISEETNDLATDIQDFVNTFTGGKEEIIKVDALLKDLEQVIADVMDNTELEQAVKEQMLEGLIDSQCALQQISNSLSTTTNSGGRLAVSSCTSCTSIPDCLKKATESALKFTSAIWKGLKNAISCNGTYANQQGLVPRCWWKNEKLSSVCELNDCASGAFYAGIIDGAWETVTGIGSILEAISCNNPCILSIAGLPCSDIKEYTSSKCVAIRSVTDNLYSLAAENVKETGASALNGSLFKEFVSYFTDGNDCGTDGVEPDACRNYKAGKAMLVVVDIIEGVGAAKALIKSGRSLMEAAMRRAINYARQLKAGTAFKFALSATRKELNVFVGGKLIGNQTDKGLLLTNKTDNIGTSIAHAENVEVYNPITKQTEVGSLDVDANGKCKFGPKCFVAGTPVHTRQGIRPIERIKPGDEVLSRDEQTGQQTYKRVTRTFVKAATRLVKVFAGNDTLLTTPEHPFRIGNRWVGAGMLQKGDALQRAEVATTANVPYLPRANLEVDSIAALDTTATVYNFEVADFHTYFVGRQGVWVHNAYNVIHAGPNTVYKLNGQYPKNYGYANKWATAKGGRVYFDGNGFPDFTPYVARNANNVPYAYEINMQGINDLDFAEANRAAGFGSSYNAHKTFNGGKYKDYVWHHHQDTKTMMLVPSNINTPGPSGGISHSGGVAVLNHNKVPENDFLIFPSPVFR